MRAYNGTFVASLKSSSNVPNRFLCTTLHNLKLLPASRRTKSSIYMTAVIKLTYCCLMELILIIFEWGRWIFHKASVPKFAHVFLISFLLCLSLIIMQLMMDEDPNPSIEQWDLRRFRYSVTALINKEPVL